MVSRDEYGVYIYRNAEMSDSDKVLDWETAAL